jgi:uncharacterized protein (DUF433 family)
LQSAISRDFLSFVDKYLNINQMSFSPWRNIQAKEQQRIRLTISKDSNILGGTPVFAGTEVPFQMLLNYIENGKMLDDFLKDFPKVTREVAITALEEVKRLALAQIDRSKPKAADRSHALSDFVDLATLLLRYIEDGKTLNEFLKDSPSVKHEVATAALEQLKTLAFVQLDRSHPKVADRPHMLSVFLGLAALIVSAFSSNL